MTIYDSRTCCDNSVRSLEKLRGGGEADFLCKGMGSVLIRNFLPQKHFLFNTNISELSICRVLVSVKL